MSEEKGESPDSPKGFTILSSLFYRMARVLTEQEVQGEGSVRVRGGLPITAVILSQACLEAYLNEFLVVERTGYADKWEYVMPSLTRLSLPEKWLFVARHKCGKTFNTGEEPFQSFKLLVALRNELVHYAPEFRPLAELPNKMLHGLKSKFDFEYEDQSDWTTQILIGPCAVWSCDTAKAIITKFHELIGILDPWQVKSSPLWED